MKRSERNGGTAKLAEISQTAEMVNFVNLQMGEGHLYIDWIAMDLDLLSLYLLDEMSRPYLIGCLTAMYRSKLMANKL
jgi:hypothetical protein